MGFTNLTVCSEAEERLEFNIGSDLCGKEINFCGYFTFENGSAFTDCSLSCSSVPIVCPTTPSTGSTPGMWSMDKMTSCSFHFNQQFL